MAVYTIKPKLAFDLNARVSRAMGVWASTCSAQEWNEELEKKKAGEPSKLDRAHWVAVETVNFVNS